MEGLGLAFGFCLWLVFWVKMELGVVRWDFPGCWVLGYLKNGWKILSFIKGIFLYCFRYKPRNKAYLFMVETLYKVYSVTNRFIEYKSHRVIIE